jgi:hypothetical protein
MREVCRELVREAASREEHEREEGCDHGGSPE